MKMLKWIPVHAFLKIVIIQALLMLLLLSSASSPVQAQDAPGTVTLPVIAGTDIRFTALTGEEGLSSGNVYGIAQDNQGFLWFATGDGLSRYDGYSFRIFRFDRDNSNSPSNNFISAILQGRGNVLWLATTGGGVDRFDPATETFTHYRHDPDNPNSLSGNHISKYGLYEDRQGALWVGAVDNGLNRLDPATGIFTRYRHDPQDDNSLSSNGIESIYQDSDGMMWIGTSDAGLNRLDPVSGKITRYLPNPDDPYTLPDVYVHGTYEDRAGTFWVGTEKGFGSLDRKTGRFTRYVIAPDQPDAASLNAIMQFHEDSLGNLWLGTGGAGILKFDRQQGQVVQYKNDPGNPHSLRNNFISSFHEDPSGTLWAGTLGGGANVFSIRPPKFAHYKHEADNPNSVADNFILSIFEDHTGSVWIGNDRTLNRWDRQSDTWQVYRNDSANPDSISNGSVTATQEDPDGTLWFGTFLGGLNRFDPKTGHFKAYRFDSNDPHSLSDDIIRSLYRDSNGVLWVGGWNNGLSRFDRVTETFQRYLSDPGKPDSLSAGSVTDIYEDRAKTLWVGTEGGGLNRFDPSTETFKRFQNDAQNLKSLPDDAVRVLYEDQVGQFWVGTAAGLCMFDRANGTCTAVYTVKEGLPNNTIEGILEDEQGNLWISTNDGLSRFTPQTKAFRNYDVLDGLQSNEFNVFTAFYKSQRTGEMYFGGINGFNVFDPSQVADDPFVPPVVLTDFRLFGKSVSVGGDSVLQKTINEIDGVTLTYNQNSISFEFSALSYVVPTKNRYRYKLEGFDADWREVDSKERLAVYTNLDAGDYIFRAQGTNEDGVWNEQGTALKITITPPWWATWWFRTAAIVGILALVYSGYRLRVRSIQQRSQELERQVAERTRDLQIAADVSRQITTVLDIERLLQQVVTLTIQGFDLYMAAIFMVDGDNLKLTHAAAAHLTSEALEESLVHIPIDAEPSIIALAARTQETVTVNDVRQSPLFLPLSILPETRSELAIPMRLGNQLLGVFDLQAEQLNRFSDEDLRVLTTLADQIAIAVQNAQLFAASQAAQQKAEAANQAKSAFLSSMSHELRTPLNAILGYADILKRRTGHTGPLTDGLDIIEQSGEHLLTLINDVLDLAKIEAGKMDMTPAPFHLPKFLRQIIDIIRARAEAKDITLTYEPLLPLPATVVADEKRLRQVLLNLLGNAVKFTDQGHVTLRVTANAEGMQSVQNDEGAIPDIHHSAFTILHFEVEDTGIGIPPDQLERIFQPFEQAGGTERRAEGAGLGLAISQQIMHLMNSRLQVKSEPDCGSTFWLEVSLPVMGIIEQEQPASVREIIGYEGARQKVLVADDKEFNRRLLVDILQPLGFEVRTAENGQQAVEEAQAWQPNVILMDLVMPVKTGIEATLELRQQPALASVLIVAVSASVLDADEEKSRVVGCDAFLRKPVKMEKLLDLLEAHLKLSWLRAEPKVQRDMTAAPLISPPQEELTMLCKLAQSGRILDIQARADHLAKLDEAYLPFCDRLHELARDFELDQIVAFIRQFIKEEHNEKNR